MLKIGQSVTFRSLDAFYNGATTQGGKQYLINMLRRLIGFEQLICLEVERISKAKWQVTEICTEDNNYILEDSEAIFLKADFYDTKSLLNAKPVKWYNSLLGERTEYRVKAEQNT